MEKGEENEKVREMSEEEFENRLEIANIFINSYFYVYYDDSDSTSIYRKINSLLAEDAEASRIFSGIGGIEQDLEYEKTKIIEEVLRIVYGKSFINTDNMTYQELKKLYEEMGFDETFCDDCIIFGFVKLKSGYAVIYTYSLPKSPETEIEFEIIKQQD